MYQLGIGGINKILKKTEFEVSILVTTRRKPKKWRDHTWLRYEKEAMFYYFCWKSKKTNPFASAEGCTNFCPLKIKMSPSDQTLSIWPISAFTRFHQCQAFHGGYWVSTLHFSAWEMEETNGTRLHPMDTSTEITGPFEVMWYTPL